MRLSKANSEKPITILTDQGEGYVPTFNRALGIVLYRNRIEGHNFEFVNPKNKKRDQERKIDYWEDSVTSDSMVMVCYEKNDMNEKKEEVIDNLEWIDGDTETEIYFDRNTNKKYQVSISIERDWDGMIEID